VAVGFEPTNGLPRYTLSSSENPRSGMVVDVRFVLKEPPAVVTERSRTTTNETRTETKDAAAADLPHSRRECAPVNGPVPHEAHHLGLRQQGMAAATTWLGTARWAGVACPTALSRRRPKRLSRDPSASSKRSAVARRPLPMIQTLPRHNEAQASPPEHNGCLWASPNRSVAGGGHRQQDLLISGARSGLRT